MPRNAKTPQKHPVGVAEFKARCLELLEGVGSRGDEITVTADERIRWSETVPVV